MSSVRSERVVGRGLTRAESMADGALDSWLVQAFAEDQTGGCPFPDVFVTPSWGFISKWCSFQYQTLTGKADPLAAVLTRSGG